MRSIFLVLVVCITVGCAHKHSLVGYWRASPNTSDSVMVFMPDNKLRLESKDLQNAFEGTYELKGNELTMHLLVEALNGGKEPPMTFEISWKSEDEIAITGVKGHDVPLPSGTGFVRMTTAQVEQHRKELSAMGGETSRTPSSVPATCLSNLKQLSMGALMYVQDYDEVMPDTDRWHETLLPYIKSDAAFTCPAVRLQGHENGYAFNSGLSGIAVNKVKEPQNTMMIFETSNLVANASDAGSSECVPPRHEGKNNRSYADGHVHSYP
jgi:prepilin-type processing-associated H-X9-DG protein